MFGWVVFFCVVVSFVLVGRGGVHVFVLLFSFVLLCYVVLCCVFKYVLFCLV